MENKKILLLDQKIGLKNAEFHILKRAEGPVKAVVKDEVISAELKDRDVFITFKRTLTADPSSVYIVFVEFSYAARLDEQSLKNLEEKGENNNDGIKKYAPSIIQNTNICSVASNIISNLTGVNTNKPFITPPFFIK